MYREITIRPVLNGFKVQVGCQEVVFVDLDAMLVELGKYYRDPRGREEAYLTTVHAAHVAPPGAAPATPSTVSSAYRAGEANTGGLAFAPGTPLTPRADR